MVEALAAAGYNTDTLYLIDLLKRPFGDFFDYRQEWSLNRLKMICEKENLPIPDEELV